MKASSLLYGHRSSRGREQFEPLHEFLGRLGPIPKSVAEKVSTYYEAWGLYVGHEFEPRDRDGMDLTRQTLEIDLTHLDQPFVVRWHRREGSNGVIKHHVKDSSRHSSLDDAVNSLHISIALHEADPGLRKLYLGPIPKPGVGVLLRELQQWKGRFEKLVEAEC